MADQIQIKGTDAVSVVDMLDKLSKVDADKVNAHAKAEEAKLIRTIEPAPELITPLIPDFVEDGLDIKGGTVPVPVVNVWEMIVDNRIPLFTGPTGCGKTVLAKAFVDWCNKSTYAHNLRAFEKNKDLVKHGVTDKDKYQAYRELVYQPRMLQGTGQAPTESIIGTTKFKYTGGQRDVVTVFGAVLGAAVNGHILIVDEAFSIPADVIVECHGLFDPKVKEVSFWINGEETHKKHDRYRVIFTANTRGRGENIAEYAHEQIQSLALMNRIHYVLEVGYMSPDSELMLLKGRVSGVPDTILAKMIEAANKVRELYKARTIDLVMSTREIEAWADEVRRSMKRDKKGAANDEEIWHRHVVPAAGPAIIGKTADPATAVAVSQEFSWR